MNLEDDPQQARFRATLRGWLREHCRPGGQVRSSREWGKLLFDAGYAGLTWPKVHGGAGLTPVYQGIFAEECALAGAPDHHNIIGLNMVGPTLIRYGRPAQRDRHLRRILSGEHLFCQGFSEPDAGSDLAALQTRATAVADGFVLNGEKVWSSYAPEADYCLLLARTSPAAVRHEGITCLLLDLGAPGVTVRPTRMITGEVGFGQITMTEVRVTPDDVVGEVGQGWQVALTTLTHERGTFGVTLTARLARQFQRLLDTIADAGAQDDHWVRRSAAEIYVGLEGLRQTGYRVLSDLERTGAPGPQSSILKLHWSELHQRLVDFACEVAAEHPDWGRYWRHERLRARSTTIEGGTSEILRGVIAEHVAGLPRSR